MTRKELNQAISEGRVAASYHYDMDGGFTDPSVCCIYPTAADVDDLIACSPYSDGVMMSSTTWCVAATPEMADNVPDWALNYIEIAQAREAS